MKDLCCTAKEASSQDRTVYLSDSIPLVSKAFVDLCFIYTVITNSLLCSFSELVFLVVCLFICFQTFSSS